MASDRLNAVDSPVIISKAASTVPRLFCFFPGSELCLTGKREPPREGGGGRSLSLHNVITDRCLCLVSVGRHQLVEGSAPAKLCRVGPRKEMGPSVTGHVGAGRLVGKGSAGASIAKTNRNSISARKVNQGSSVKDR